MIIYRATNTINGKCYIGQTRGELEIRKRKHINAARNGSNTNFYKAIRKYGEDAFVWDIICEAKTAKELNFLETYYIGFYDSIHHGYNMIDGGDNNIMDVPAVRERHRLKMQSAEIRNKLSNTMKQKIADGRFFTPEHRAKLSEKAKGNHNFGNSDTRSIGCYCILESDERLNFHSYRDAWHWWSNVDNPFDTKTECVYQRKIKQSIECGYYTYHYNRNGIKYEYPKWFKGGDVK